MSGRIVAVVGVDGVLGARRAWAHRCGRGGRRPPFDGARHDGRTPCMGARRAWAHAVRPYGLHAMMGARR
ncbi:MAG: hypothetical protein ACUVSS_15170, partial [Anaerolineae bacterium]